MTMNHIVLYSGADYFRPTDPSARFSRDSWAENPQGSPFVTEKKEKFVRFGLRQNPLGRLSRDLRLFPFVFLHDRFLRSKLFLERKYRIFQKMYPSWDISNSPKYLFFHTRKEKFKSVSQIRFIEYKVERAIEFLIIGENKIPITNNVVERNLRMRRSGSSLIGQRFSSLLPDREWNWTKL